MTTLKLVDPAARELAQAFMGFDPTQQGIEKYRAALDAAMAGTAPDHPVPHNEIWAPGRNEEPDARLLIYRPRSSAGLSPAILFIHASGFIAGRPEWAAAANEAMAQEQNALVVAVNYRLAPENPFPGPLEDCYTALQWIHDNASELNVDRDRVIVMGESAGGGLAAALCQLARDRAELPVAAQVLVYPMLDARTHSAEARTRNSYAGEFVWTRRHNEFAWNAMRGGQDIPTARLGHFAPSLADDLSGLPPAFVAVGALDLFVDEDVEYTLRLARAGIPVELHVYPGGIHGFDLTDSEIARQFKRDLAQALQRVVSSRKDGVCR